MQKHDDNGGDGKSDNDEDDDDGGDEKGQSPRLMVIGKWFPKGFHKGSAFCAMRKTGGIRTTLVPSPT